MKMHSGSILAVAMVSGLLLPAVPVSACSCLNLGWSASEYLAIADVGFHGTVTSIVPSSQYPGFSEITFDVLGCWKGVTSITITLITSDDPGGCGDHNFVEGGHFLAFGGDGGSGSGVYNTGICSGNQPLAPDATTYGDLGPPGEPGSCEVTPVETPTWGRVKALYP